MELKSINEKTESQGHVFGLLGRKLGHSYSAELHRAFGCESYRLIELEKEELEGFLKNTDIGGMNVTIPYKLDVMPLCDEIAPEAQSIGSVNTIIRENGKLIGYNTDAFGLIYALKCAGIELKGKKTLIFGSGGASLTAQYVSGKAGASEVIVISRSGKDNYENLSRHSDAQVIINATPVGMYPDNGKAPAELEIFKCLEGVADMIYNPARTALIMQAERLRIRNTDGLPMLVAQAAEAERIFTGRKISESETQKVLKSIRAQNLNIVLIGMPGCGKTSIGEKLGELTGREVIDIDSEIVKASGQSIADIFKKGGESAFRALETEQIARAGKKSGAVIVTGGGAVTRGENYAPLHQNGRLYHIERALSDLPRDGRPLSENADLEQMYKKRLPLYERFRDETVKNDGTVEEAAQRIWSSHTAAEPLTSELCV